MFFEFDVKEILRANIKERYEAYGKALQDGWKTINEIRKEEKMNNIDGMDVLSLGLGDVLYDTQTGTYYTPNTGQTTSGETTAENNVETVEENVEGGEQGWSILKI